jgi:PhnB protein
MKRMQEFSRREFVSSAAAVAAVAAFHPRAEAWSLAPTTTGEKEKMTKLTPYLLFDGRCREAMEFYQSCLGGKLTMKAVKETPAKDQMQAFQQDWILNAHLDAGLMEISASDWLALDETPVRGSTVCMYLRGGSFGELKTLFDKLSEGAKVTDPLKETFFGTYGALNDRFGVRWMFHANKENG